MSVRSQSERYDAVEVLNMLCHCEVLQAIALISQLADRIHALRPYVW
jgi:hypothetical protein